MREEDMNNAIDYVLAIYPDAHIARVKIGYSMLEWWVICDKKIPTTVISKAPSPYHAWIYARATLSPESMTPSLAVEEQ